MQLHRPALRGSAQVGLVRYSILVVTQPVGGLRHQFDERDAQIRLRAFSPFGQAGGKLIEQQTAKAGIVLGQVVNGRPFGRRGRSGHRRRATIERVFALDLKREFFRGEVCKASPKLLGSCRAQKREPARSRHA